jgi:son of sevenless
MTYRLSSEPSQEMNYRATFLNTFKSFTTAEHLLDTLLSYYEMETPASLDPTECIEWKEKKLWPTQTR